MFHTNNNRTWVQEAPWVQAYPEMAQACFAFFVELIQAAQFSLLGLFFSFPWMQSPHCTRALHPWEPQSTGTSCHSPDDAKCPNDAAASSPARWNIFWDMLNSRLEVISWTHTSPKDIPMTSSTAEAARYPMHMDFLHCHYEPLSNLLALGKAKKLEVPRAQGKSLANKAWVIAAPVLSVSKPGGLKTALGSVEVALTSLDCS